MGERFRDGVDAATVCWTRAAGMYGTNSLYGVIFLTTAGLCGAGHVF
jgi:hypothetical protein